MQRFLFIATNECEWGGSEVLWTQAAERLARRGAEVRTSVPMAAASSVELNGVKATGCRIAYRKLPSLLSRGIRKVLPLGSYAETHLRSLARGADLVVFSQGSLYDGLPWLEAARVLGLKYAVIVQGASELHWPDDTISEKLAHAFDSAASAYFVSEATKGLCQRQFGHALPHGRVIRNPFKVRYDLSLPWPADSSNSLLFSCVGRLEVSCKGQDVLLEVLGLPHWRQRDVRVSLVGRGQSERILRRRAAELKLANLDFTGHTSDIEAVWSKHHALVLPSRFEGMPLVVVEAMLCGRPCIVTDVGGNRELVRDGINGFLAKAPTIGLLDEAMNRAWEDRRRLREMGEQAATDVRRWVSADPVEDFVRELTALAGGAREMETAPVGQCQPSPR